MQVYTEIACVETTIAHAHACMHGHAYSLKTQSAGTVTSSRLPSVLQCVDVPLNVLMYK